MIATKLADFSLHVNKKRSYGVSTAFIVIQKSCYKISAEESLRQIISYQKTDVMQIVLQDKICKRH